MDKKLAGIKERFRLLDLVEADNRFTRAKMQDKMEKGSQL
jgi:hypothetical protein